MYVSCIVEVSSPSFCPLSALCLNLGLLYLPPLLIQQWQHPPSTPSSLVHLWKSLVDWPWPWPKNSSPWGSKLNWLSTPTTSTIKFLSLKCKFCHFWQWFFIILLIVSCCDFTVQLRAHGCPCKELQKHTCPRYHFGRQRHRDDS